MLNYLFRRLNLLFITGFILTVIAFSVTYLSIYGKTAEANYFIDYFQYISALIKGDWGVSVIDQQPILNKGLSAFLSTLELCFVAFVVAHIIALPLGITAALNRNRPLDIIIMAMVLIGLAIPVFWLAILCTMLPQFLNITLPLGDSIYEYQTISAFFSFDAIKEIGTENFDDFINHVMHLLLPSAVLSVFLISELTLLTRNSVTAIMKSNYIKAAFAKGLSRKQIILNHVIKNALPPVIHQIRLQLNTILSFAMVIEFVFSMQGTGAWLLESINEGDYLALPTALLLISGFILITSIFVDILLVVISPIKRKSLYVD